MGNAAIAGIQAENARNATKPAQAAIEINPGSPQLQVRDINGPLAPIGPVAYTAQSGDTLSESLAARQAFIAQVEAKGGPAINPATASPSDWADYVNSYSQLGESPAGAQTLGEMVVTPDYSYVKASPAENAYFASMNRYLDSVSVDPAETARVNAARAQQYTEDLANQRALDAMHAQDEQYLATLPYQIGKGAFKSVVNSVAALPQQIWNGMKMYGAADLDYAAASASLASNNTASVQLSDAADATRTAALQPAWVPFQNLSPEEQFGGDVAMVAGLFTGYGETQLGGMVESVAPLMERIEGAGTPFEQIMAKLQGMDFSTAPNTALFYSGIGTGDTARALAAERGLVTISNTEGGAYLESFGDLYGANSPVSRGEADQLWGFASQQYANGASGDVTAILNDPKPNRIYLSIEQKILQNNPNVKLTETQIMDWYAPAGNYH